MKKVLILFLILSIFVHLSSPIVKATENNPNETINTTVSEDVAVYSYACTDYFYCICLDTSTANGSFAVTYSDDPEYIFEYIFTVPLDSVNTSSDTFWNDLAAECFSNSFSWKSIYLPTSITVSDNSANTAQTYSVDPYLSRLAQKAQDAIGIAPYTGRVVATSYQGSLIFHVYEDLTYYGHKVRTITLADGMSVASLITGILTLFFPTEMVVLSRLVSVISLGFGAGSLFISAGTTISGYYAYAKWERYVKRRDSSVWLTESTQRFINYIAFVNPDTGFCEIDEDSEKESYAPSQTYFENTTALLNKGYAYYLTLP